MGMMSWGMGIWMLLGTLLLLIVIVALVGGGVLLVRKLARPRRRASEVGLTATETLHRRYAAGEIDDDELAHRLAQING